MELDTVEFAGDVDNVDASDPAAIALFAAESDYATSIGELHPHHLSLRHDAASLLLQAQHTGNMDPSAVYLAINYVDRFLSRQATPPAVTVHAQLIIRRGQHCSFGLQPPIPVSNISLVMGGCLCYLGCQVNKPWIVQLLATACLSLACKMNNTPFSVACFPVRIESCLTMKQGGLGPVPDGGSILRMELLVLTALSWRMRSVTPFNFLRFFLPLFRPGDRSSAADLEARASQILFRAQREAKLVDYKPSVAAASALLAAAHELFPDRFPAFRAAVSSCSRLEKVTVLNTIKLKLLLLSSISSCFIPLFVRGGVGLLHRDVSAAGSNEHPPSASRRGRGLALRHPVKVLLRHRRRWSSPESEDPTEKTTRAATSRGVTSARPPPGMAALCASHSAE
ncbi:hypothetical protein Taro_032510 [Colocasia esculenta]|uniref:Uncharacterized protein n=1 Tax=Colocasia esculenta TaxID=4460 RepID=A0A843VRI9_COLES|nr:hypothetical protein [Colocasia esculenta]